jgi:hypothetical protein
VDQSGIAYRHGSGNAVQFETLSLRGSKWLFINGTWPSQRLPQKQALLPRIARAFFTNDLTRLQGRAFLLRQQLVVPQNHVDFADSPISGSGQRSPQQSPHLKQAPCFIFLLPKTDDRRAAASRRWHRHRVRGDTLGICRARTALLCIGSYTVVCDEISVSSCRSERDASTWNRTYFASVRNGTAWLPSR